MECYNKGPLTQAEKERIIREAEKHGPLSEMEKARILREAEKERVVCHPTKADTDFIKKLLLGLALLGALGLLYYLYKHSVPSHETVPVTMRHYEEAKKPVTEEEVKTVTVPVREEVKTERTNPA